MTTTSVAAAPPSVDAVRRPNPLTRNLSAKIAAVPMIATALVIFVGCTAWSVYYSFTASKLLPVNDFVGLAQYYRLFSTHRWYQAMQNVVIFGVMSMTFSLVVGFVLAALLDQKIRFENTFRTIYLHPFAMSFIVTGLVWQWILTPLNGIEKVVRDLGWENFVFDWLVRPDTAIYCIVIAGLWQGTGLVMALMLAGLRGIDDEIWKAARVDGIPTWKTYIFIVIPMMRPVLVTTVVLISTGIIRVYDLVVAMTNGGPGTATDVPAKYVINMLFSNGNLGQGLAASTVMLAVVLVILVPWSIREYSSRAKHGV
jgi:glucose/mannose transport system permease protein